MAATSPSATRNVTNSEVMAATPQSAASQYPRSPRTARPNAKRPRAYSASAALTRRESNPFDVAKRGALARPERRVEEERDEGEHQHRQPGEDGVGPRDDLVRPPRARLADAAAPQELEDHDDGDRAQAEQPRQDVRRQRRAETERREPVAPSLARPACEQADREQGQREREGERVLARHRREQVPAVDRERGVEEERQRGDRQGHGDRSGCPEEPPEGIGGDGQDDRAEDGGQLEGDGEADHVAGEGREHVGQDEVVGVGGNAVEPPGVPGSEVEDVARRAQVRRQRQVRPRVATREERRGDQEVRVQRPHRDVDHRQDEHGVEHPEGRGVPARPREQRARHQ